MFDVLAGKESVKINIAVDTKSIIYIGIAVFVTVLVGVVIARLIVK